MIIRHLEPADFDLVFPVLNDWWGGRPVRGLLPRLFFEHFQPTSFALMEDLDLVGFLVGFQSQSDHTISYIHFVGIHPDARRKGYGRLLYERFFLAAANHGCTEVRSITSPINEVSIRFHLGLGFRILPGDGQVNGYPVSSEHGGPGQPRVLFSKQLV